MFKAMEDLIEEGKTVDLRLRPSYRLGFLKGATMVTKIQLETLMEKIQRGDSKESLERYVTSILADLARTEEAVEKMGS
jgi:hypothetical protein